MKNNLISKKRVAIIGGGPVGLTAARLLQLKGIDVKVYERDINENARITGGTLDLHTDTGQMVMKKAGLFQIFSEYARPTGQAVANMKGNIVMSMKPDKSKPEIDRPDLRKILLQSLSSDTIVWDSHIQDIQSFTNHYEFQYQDGKKAQADIVIIADGAMSKTRKLVTQTLPEETGTFVIQGEVANPAATCPRLWKLANGNNLAVVEDKKTLFWQQRGNNTLCFYVSFRKEEQWIRDYPFDFSDTNSVNKFLYKLFKNWNPVYYELFEASTDYACFPLRTMHAGEKWPEHSNATLIGDAAHLMPPFGGMGVNMGMMDTYHLTENLTNGKFTDVKSAINDYEKKMMDYATPVQKETHGADDRIHNSIEHSMNNFKKKLWERISNITQYITLFLFFLVTGIFWGNYFSFSRSFHMFSAAELTHIANQLVTNLSMPMRILGMSCFVFLIATIYLFKDKKSKEFYFLLASVLLILTSFIITVIVEIPINNQIVNWTPDNLPFNWEAIRNKWQLFNVVRTSMAVTAFALYITSILKPFKK